MLLQLLYSCGNKTATLKGNRRLRWPSTHGGVKIRVRCKSKTQLASTTWWVVPIGRVKKSFTRDLLDYLTDFTITSLSIASVEYVTVVVTRLLLICRKSQDKNVCSCITCIVNTVCIWWIDGWFFLAKISTNKKVQRVTFTFSFCSHPPPPSIEQFSLKLCQWMPPTKFTPHLFFASLSASSPLCYEYEIILKIVVVHHRSWQSTFSPALTLNNK